MDTAKHVVAMSDGTTLSQPMNDDVFRVGITIPEFMAPSTVEERTNVKCNICYTSLDIIGTRAQIWSCCLYKLPNDAVALVGVPIEYNTSALALQMLVNKGCEFVAKLASPQTFQLTAEQVSGILTTLYGQNNVWTDVGEVSVDYPADTKLYIDNKIATAVANALNA